jgi:5-methylcytosine-specific restriction endonuclease McrA
MPKRTKVSQDLIVSTYEKTKSKRETARVLGIHEQTVYIHLRGSEGRCIRCGGSPKGGYRHCHACLKTLREDVKRKRRERVRLGVCVQCDERIQPPSRLYCATHRTMALDSNKRYDERQRQSRFVHGGTPTKKQRKRSIGEKYGLGGIHEWHFCEGRCRICGIPHEERAVHIHHVDCDPKNNSKENLKALCQRCHRLVHNLTEHPDPAGAISWIRTHYPDLPL